MLLPAGVTWFSRRSGRGTDMIYEWWQGGQQRRVVLDRHLPYKAHQAAILAVMRLED